VQHLCANTSTQGCACAHPQAPLALEARLCERAGAWPTVCPQRVCMCMCAYANKHARAPQQPDTCAHPQVPACLACSTLPWPLRSRARLELGGEGVEESTCQGQRLSSPDLHHHPPPTPLVFERGGDGVAVHLLVRRHLVLAWVEAPKLAWASTGADWPRPPSFPPAVFTYILSKVCYRAMLGRGWWERVGGAHHRSRICGRITYSLLRCPWARGCGP